jgi:Transmembrane family 220, helix
MPDLALLAAAAFLFFSSYVNLNDPDAWLWSTAYGLAGTLCTACSVMMPSSRAGLHGIATVGSLAALGLSAYSFSQLDGLKVSGSSGWLGVFELEYVREGGGALLMFLSMLLCARVTGRARGSKPGAVALGPTLSAAAVLVAGVGIGLGVYLPSYYRQLGVGIPEHCGGGDAL